VTLLDAITVYTASDLARLPNARDFELVDGELVERHTSMESSRVASRINRLFGTEADQTREAVVYDSELGYPCFADDRERVRRADVTVIHRDRVERLGGDRGHCPIPAHLAVEVVSPNDLASAVVAKVRDYLGNRFPLVWVVQPLDQTVAVHRRDGLATVVSPGQHVTAEPALAAFRCDVAAFFE
jgi:Uma2 family endonuclease